MRPNQPSTPTLSLIYTSFQPRSGENTNSDKDNHPYGYNTSDYYSPASPLSSTSTITSSSPTLPSSPTSPYLSPTLFQHIRPISDKLQPLSSLSPSHGQGYCQSHTSSPAPGAGTGGGIILRRRPSTIDTLLRQERSRATVDAIERQGLDLLEPRPVDLDPVGNAIDNRIEQSHQTITHHRLPLEIANGHGINIGDGGQTRERARDEALGDGSGLRPAQPKFVMGGIFEVMEGRG
ncbi:uncharacterized protein BDV17DRAFT_210507 [Aspergillus undulatus]|uniref:uncharacterized protein n=1 Tax=Aspergillus undulatus TaxID=1810928 RepID=UPI003CCD9AE3